MDVDEAVRVLELGQLYAGEIHAQERVAGIDEARELRGDEFADVLLRLLGGAPDVRREDDVGEILKLGEEFLVVAFWFFRKYVDGGPPYLSAPDVLCEGREVTQNHLVGNTGVFLMGIRVEHLQDEALQVPSRGKGKTRKCPLSPLMIRARVNNTPTLSETNPALLHIA